MFSREDGPPIADGSDMDHIFEDEPGFDRPVELLLSGTFDLFVAPLLSNP
jgi:hypothetical protein